MITYISGDATFPVSDGRLNIITHVCNNRGGWGRGFVVALSNRWSAPETQYRDWYKNGFSAAAPFKLGEIGLSKVEDDTWVVNMIAQDGYGKNNSSLHKTDEPNARPPIRYDALKDCLTKANVFAVTNNGSIHGPKFGSGLAGGSWDEIGEIIESVVTVPVYIYEF